MYDSGKPVEQGEIFVAGGIRYEVIRRWTPEDYRANNYPKTAELLEEYRESARVFLKRGKGKSFYEGREYPMMNNGKSYYRIANIYKIA
jgi:hypothetical protein